MIKLFVIFSFLFFLNCYTAKDTSKYGSLYENLNTFQNLSFFKQLNQTEDQIVQKLQKYIDEYPFLLKKISVKN